MTVNSSSPANFMNEEREFVYDFSQDETGEKLYGAVQDAVDAARAEGAELVYVMGHLGNIEACSPWTYAEVVANTNGIDVFLDGHSHDIDQIIMKNKEGEDVPRSAVGTKMANIGYSHISAEGEVIETGIWSWPNKISAPVLLNIRNETSEAIETQKQNIAEMLDVVVAATDVRLVISDPAVTDTSGKPIRLIRRTETNLGDLCADAYRDQSGADIGYACGGSIRADLEKGDITYEKLISVFPFGNMLCVKEVKGQQILDALEWGSRALPGENPAFLHVSGMTYEINTRIDSPCQQDENGMFTGVEGERRVQNVMVGDEPLDPEKTYTIAGQDYSLLNDGDGFTMFDGAPVISDGIKIDNQALIDYIVDTLGGKVGEEYEDPYGQGRITVLE